jgi:hypothetical protein
VTDSNKNEYFEKFVRVTLISGIEQQLQALRSGFERACKALDIWDQASLSLAHARPGLLPFVSSLALDLFLRRMYE